MIAVEASTKEKAERILAEAGLTRDDAMALLYRQIVHSNGLPWELHVPNAETLAAIKGFREAPESFERHSDFASVLASLDETDGPSGA
jgi:DNA-damage-inducible protein J